MRWCAEGGHWHVYAWARSDGDASFVDVHPMWQEPRIVADDEYMPGTLLQLLSAVQRTTRRLADDAARGQSTLW